ncbi:MAG: carbohydrate-binding protein, partial [Chloroflexota bacterium]|nr:carbohydrate-binding protein [Chloroflexota bacterium]
MKRQYRFWVALVLILTLLAPASALPRPSALTFAPTIAHAATTGTLITKVYTDKARYNPGNTVVITAQLKNTTGASWTGTLSLSIKKLETQVHTATSASITLANGASTTTTFNWTAPAGDFTGYYAGVTAGTVDFNGTGIDVSSSPLRFPRYGYISDFPTSRTATQSTDMVKQMAQDYHINMFQFYDWMWRHEKMLKRSNGTVDSTWVDLFNRTISYQTIQNDITAVHNHNAIAMAYAMSYAAREGYEQMWGISPTWGMFSDTAHASQLNVDFKNGAFLWLFNPANENWQNYIINEYKDAINTAAFDGVQIDQMGQRNNVYDYNGFSHYIPPTFPQFLQSVKSSLQANNSARSAVTFNIVDGTVDGWAANQVSTYGASDFDFSEIWYLSNSYNQLRNYVEQLRRNSGGKPVVLAGYMNYGEDLGTKSEAETATRVGVTTNTNHAGYTGTGFVDGFDAVGDSITWSVNFPETRDYSLVFRYANSTGGTATRNVYVDGTLLGQVSFSNQANWDTWAYDAWI